MKKFIKYFVLVISFMFILCACTKSNSHIKEISLKDLKTKINNKESFALYIGNENCSHCVAYLPTLEEVLDKYNITVYHLDNSKLSTNELSKLKEYVNITGTPTIAFLVKGEEESTLYRITGEASYDTTVQKFKDAGYIK